MKRLLVFLMFLLAAGFAFAQSSQTEQPQAPQEPSAVATDTMKSDTPSLSGTVESIDMDTKTITVRDESGKTMKYTFNTATTFSRHDQPFTVTELKTGDKVTYIVNDGGVISTLTIDEDETNPPQK